VKRDYLQFSDLTADETYALLDRADALKAERRSASHPRPLAGRSVALLFEKPSTRTRVSFEVGVFELGGHPVVMSSRDMQLGRGESIEDTARTLSRYVDAIVLRTFGHARIETLAAAASVPVVNALTDDHHPCQVLADLQTVRAKKGTLAGLRYAWVGDGNNMARSWAQAAELLGLPLTVASPEGYRLEGVFGPTVAYTHSPAEAVAGADVVITDTWASMGQEQEAAQRKTDFAGYKVDPALMRGAAAGAMVLHCLPAYRGQEVDAVYLDGPEAVVWDEAENRLHAQKALLEQLLRGGA